MRLHAIYRNLFINCLLKNYFQSVSKYTEVFPKLLSVASENRPILIVIDGLDQVNIQNWPLTKLINILYFSFGIRTFGFLPLWAILLSGRRNFFLIFFLIYAQNLSMRAKPTRYWELEKYEYKRFGYINGLRRDVDADILNMI